jgi:FtsP/CotA-like multicopper oxidase with cupredoxin domain
VVETGANTATKPRVPSSGTSKQNTNRQGAAMKTGILRLIPITIVASIIASRAMRAANPACAFQNIDVTTYGYQPLQNPPEERSVNGILQTTLVVKYTDPSKTTIGGCPVTLRSYNGQLVGPTLRIRSGDLMSIRLDNKLPPETPAEVAAQTHQESDNAFIETRPHSFNTANLHTHGLHVSPVGNSDNVFLAIGPGTTFQYEIQVPANHPAGTFWYHAHAHGSTSIQVGSGMEGALIIDDDPTKIPSSIRDADKNEKILVLQTTLYDADGEVKDITSFFPGPPNDPNCKAQKSSCTWAGSKRRVTINGQILPVISMRPGEVQRWRFIDAAFRESFNLRLEGHVLHEIALDGLYMSKVDDWDGSVPNRTLELEPGYRSDVLVKAGQKPGLYSLVDVATPGASAPQPPCLTSPLAAAAIPLSAQSVSSIKAVPAIPAANLSTEAVTLAGAVRTSLLGVDQGENVIAVVRIEGSPVVPEMKLPTDAEMAQIAAFRGVDLEKQAVDVQEAVFKLGSGYDPNDQRAYFQINGHAFDPAHVRYLKLNQTDVWSLSTVGDPPCIPRRPPGTSNPSLPPLPHVFHIHVNPFQTVRAGPGGTPERVWKDTLLIPPGAHLRVFTQYTDYIGQFVMHCHILDHEDLGMMEVEEVVQDSGEMSLLSHGH